MDNQSIMGAGMEKLLSGVPSLEVMGIDLENEATLVQDISRLLPDIVIMIVESQGTTPVRLLELLDDYGRLRIILLSMTSNCFEVYEKRPVVARNWASLINVCHPSA